jgi:dihydrofolate reductase
MNKKIFTLVVLHASLIVQTIAFAQCSIMEGQMNSRPFDLLLGRKTFEIFASYWPAHENGWPGINKKTKYVASNSLTNHTWSNSVFLKGNVVGEIKKLKQQDGPDLQVYGSANLSSTLMQHGLIDEYRLGLNPVVLGNGNPLFKTLPERLRLKLVEARPLKSGCVILRYQPA